jgi:hypothetical protein
VTAQTLRGGKTKIASNHAGLATVPTMTIQIRDVFFRQRKK